MTFFLKFHIYLGSTNKTTIENLDKKGRPYKSVYDIGSINNIYQILGTNKWLWPFPVFCGSGKPLGDGIYWATNIKEDEGAYSSQKKRETEKSGDRKSSPMKSIENSAASKYPAGAGGGAN
jgi:hypothetical protein